MKICWWHFSFVMLLLSACQLLEEKPEQIPIQAASINSDSSNDKGLSLQLTGAPSDTIIAEYYFQKVDAFLDDLKQDSALIFAEKAKDVFLKYLDENNIKVGDACNWIGQCLAEDVQRYNDAIISYENALQVYLKQDSISNTKIYDIYRDIGHVYEKKREYDTAFEYYQKVVDYLSLLPSDSSSHWGRTYMIIGGAYMKVREYEEASKYFSKALSINIINSDSIEIANCYNHFGALYYNDANYNKALESFERALYIRIKTLGPDHRKTADDYQNIGIIYRHKARFDKAIEHQEKALGIYRKYGDNHSQVANIYANLSSNYIETGELQKAEEYLQKAANIYTETIGYYNFSHASVLLKLGVRHERAQQHAKALIYYDKALDIYHQFPLQRTVGERAQISINKGVIHHRDGSYDEALRYYNESLDILSDTYNENAPVFINLYNMIGFINREKGLHETAFAYYQKALQISILNYDSIHPLVAESYNLISDHYLQKNNLIQARKYSNLVFKSLNYNPGESLDSCLSIIKLIPYLSERTEIEYLSFQKTDSLHYLQRAYHIATIGVNAFNKLKNSYLSHASKKELMTSIHSQIFENAIKMSLYLDEKQGSNTNKKDIFRYMEQSKASLLREIFRKSDAKYTLTLPQKLLDKEYDLKSSITLLEKERYQKTVGVSDIMRDSIHRHYTILIGEANRSVDSLQQKIKEEYPEDYRLLYDDTVMSLEDVQKTLLAPNQVLIEYFLGDSSLFVFAIRPDIFILKEIKLDENHPLREWIKQMNESILLQEQTVQDELTPQKLDSATYQYAHAAYKIYQTTILPIESILSKESELIIIPDGVLSYVSFDALLTNLPSKRQQFHSFPYLLKRHQISVDYSATMLMEMTQKKHKTPPKEIFLGFAPSFPSNDKDTLMLASRHIDYSNKRNRLAPLKHNITEVESIQSIIGGDIYTGSIATKKVFMDKAPNYQIIHLATHGKFNDMKGDFSFLAFYKNLETKENDWLYNRELYNLSLNTNMVVLSACETGIGEWQKGEGIISLARGFSFAGAKSIITTLWSVNDMETSKLMERFYYHIKSGMTKDSALRQAKLDYLESLETSHHPEPYYWAAFVPIGDMQPIFKKKGGKLPLLVISGIIIFIGSILFARKSH